MKPSRSVASFDSASGMLRALGRFLAGRDVPLLGQLPATVEPLASAVLGGVNRLPRPAVERLYAASDWTEAVPARRVGDVRAAGERLVAANPDLVLHHMHDANQDRLMIQGMTYFRIKWRRLPAAYARFLHDHLAPGGTVYVLDCGLRWPATSVSDRYVFQHGALGGATVAEFQHGSERVAAYLARYGSHRRKWVGSPTDGDRPEAEWGFDVALWPDLVAAISTTGARLCRLSFNEPEDLSPLVASLYRWWYRRRGLPADRLLVESFLLLDPWWTLRTASVPFWMVFDMEPSLARLHAYLDGTDTFDEMRLTLFSHGVDSVGLPPISAWEAILGRSRRVGTLLGVDRRTFHRDLSRVRDLSRYHNRSPQPTSLTFSRRTQTPSRSGGKHERHETNKRREPEGACRATGAAQRIDVQSNCLCSVTRKPFGLIPAPGAANVSLGPAATNFGPMAPMGSLVGHLVYGAALGLTYNAWPLLS